MVSKIPSGTVMLETFFEKSRSSNLILKIVEATPQLVQNLTTKRKSFCTSLTDAVSTQDTPTQPKVPYFFFPGKVRFCALLEKNRLNEWKYCFLFFPNPEKKKKQLWDRMNEWHVNFSVERKKHTKNRKTAEKKKYNQLLLKKRGLHKNPNEWPINFSWEIKKNKSVFFFPAPRKKKNTIFGFEWMNDQRPCPRKKKIRYLCLNISKTKKIQRPKMHHFHFTFFNFPFHFHNHRGRRSIAGTAQATPPPPPTTGMVGGEWGVVAWAVPAIYLQPYGCESERES